MAISPNKALATRNPRILEFIFHYPRKIFPVFIHAVAGSKAGVNQRLRLLSVGLLLSNCTADTPAVFPGRIKNDFVSGMKKPPPAPLRLYAILLDNRTKYVRRRYTGSHTGHFTRSC
jgi:hypothetical protein